MLTLAVRALEPTDDLLATLHTGLAAGWADDQPHDPLPTPRQWRAQVRTPFSGDPARLLVEADLRGWALVELPGHDNVHVALADLFVHPAHRRQGIGTALWQAALELARAQGRRTVLWEARAGSAMDAFAAARGAAVELEEVLREQPIATVDLGRVAELRAQAEHRARGYRLQAWTGRPPPELAGALVDGLHVLNDAPMGGLDYDGEVWDLARLAAQDTAVEDAGLRSHVALALAPDGATAGYTQVFVSEDGRYGWQWGTAVARAHRGRRLGLLLKTTMVVRLRALEPALQVVGTSNADGNTHMVDVNDALGYVPVGRLRERQIAVP